MAGETRGEKLGRFWAEKIEQDLGLMPLSQRQRNNYLAILIFELEKYSFKKRKQGEPENEGANWELDKVDSYNNYDPQILGKLIKEERHNGYNKETSWRVLNSLIDDLDTLLYELDS